MECCSAISIISTKNTDPVGYTVVTALPLLFHGKTIRLVKFAVFSTITLEKAKL